jgi:hypothetical protein
MSVTVTTLPGYMPGRSIPRRSQAIEDNPFQYLPPTEPTLVEGKEVVTRPDHYTRFKIEPITFIMANNLSFEIGNIVKYVVRAGHKLYAGKTAVESEILDLQKARRMAEMRINQLQGAPTL